MITDTTLVDVPYGKATVTLKGIWNGASVVFEQRSLTSVGREVWGNPDRPLRQHAPGSWRVMHDVLVDEFRQPFTSDETRAMYFTGGQYRLRVDKGNAPPCLTLTIEEAPPDTLIFRDRLGALVEVSDARG